MSWKNRLWNLISFLRGDFIILMRNDETLLVDAGNNDLDTLKQASTVFFREVYNLRA